MKPRTSNTAHATIRWVGTKEFRPPWLRYNPTILVDSIPDLDMTSACWDIVVREITPCSTDRTFNVTFQFASPRAPHDLLAAGLHFGLCEGPGVCVWRGTVYDTFVATRDPDDWYGENRDSQGNAETAYNMVFTLGLRHTAVVCSSLLPVVESVVVQTSFATFRAVS